MDFSKAFDKVPPWLMKKVRMCGIEGKLADWIGNWLSDRPFVRLRITLYKYYLSNQLFTWQDVSIAKKFPGLNLLLRCREGQTSKELFLHQRKRPSDALVILRIRGWNFPAFACPKTGKSHPRSMDLSMICPSPALIPVAGGAGKFRPSRPVRMITE